MRSKSRLIIQRPPADFDEVKRRFIRQNRELAKNNSNQSLRIRGLEIEVSKLLADNLDLREKVFRLESELFVARTQVSSDAVRRVKEELQAKIAELSGVVEGLDDTVGQKDDGSLKMPMPDKKPIEGQWRERQPLTEVMRDNQMPTITEDKLYPRRTLDPEQIQAIRLSDHSSNGSPDLGPPPVAHFDYEDPVKHASPSVGRVSPSKLADDDVLPGLSVNLETRRKRKDGQPKLEIRRHSILVQSPEKKDVEASIMLRTGAKRKLADREIERPIKPPSKDDFTFSRRTTLSDSKQAIEQTAEIVSNPTAEELEETERDLTVTPPKPVRKVLGDKSVNQSPRKATTGRVDKADKDDIKRKPGRPPGSKSTSVPARSESRARRVSTLPVPLPPHDNVLETVEIAPPPEQPVLEPPPKTPAAPDLFSPTPSEPSARPTESRAGTPPPGDLSTLSTSMTAGDAARPSRRARSAVNYAEPSLVAKMRRPGKQLVDAISGLQDPRRAMSVMGERKAPGSAKTVIIKLEPEDDDAWKSLPAADEGEAGGSPLGQKGSSDCSSDAVERTGVDEPEQQQANVVPSAASATISALMAGGRKRRSPQADQQQPLGMGIEATTAKLADLDVYDFKDPSSPADAGGKGPPAVKERSHRRHSSVPKNLGAKDLGFRGDAAAGTAPEPSRRSVSVAAGVGRSERAASRRRSMML